MPGGMGVNTSIPKLLLELFLLIFYSLRTLPSSVSCKPFACLPAVAGDSYENCRVYINFSQFGTLPLSTLALAGGAPSGVN
jgi:hypothetical protein